MTYLNAHRTIPLTLAVAMILTSLMGCATALDEASDADERTGVTSQAVVKKVKLFIDTNQNGVFDANTGDVALSKQQFKTGPILASAWVADPNVIADVYVLAAINVGKKKPLKIVTNGDIIATKTLAGGDLHLSAGGSVDCALLKAKQTVTVHGSQAVDIEEIKAGSNVTVTAHDLSIHKLIAKGLVDLDAVYADLDGSLLRAGGKFSLDVGSADAQGARLSSKDALHVRAHVGAFDIRGGRLSSHEWLFVYADYGSIEADNTRFTSSRAGIEVEAAQNVKAAGASFRGSAIHLIGASIDVSHAKAISSNALHLDASASASASECIDATGLDIGKHAGLCASGPLCAQTVLPANIGCTTP